MKIAEVVGRVTLNRSILPVSGIRLVLAAPMSRAAIAGEEGGRGEPIVAVDQLGTGNGSLVGLSDGLEATRPFVPDKVPIDAYCACLLDRIFI